jgi:F-type H+-transporting ATPase subunit alpha
VTKLLLSSGVVISVSSGVVSIQGFLSAFVSEMFIIHSSASYIGLFNLGFIVNLYRDETRNLSIGGLLLDPSVQIREGGRVNGTSRLPAIRLGEFGIGSILDPLGNLILNSGRVKGKYNWLIESPSPTLIDRQTVYEPLLTGIICIDGMIPVGRGQRELVVGDRQTGKSSIGVDTILNQMFEKVFCLF